MFADFDPAFQSEWFRANDAKLLEMHRKNAIARGMFLEPLRTIVAEELLAGGFMDSSGPLLELGCGTGYFGRCLAPQEIKERLMSTDISDASLAFAREQDPAGAYQLEDANHLSFSDGQYAGVIGYSSLDSMPDLSQVLSEMKRVTGPGKPMMLLQDCGVRLYNPFGLFSSESSVENYHITLVRMCMENGVSIEAEGNVECFSVISRESFVARVDRTLYPKPSPEDVLVVALDRGTPHACADRKQLEEFQHKLDIREDLQSFISENVVVQFARLKAVRGRVE